MFFDLPREADIQSYTSGMSANQWQTWERPDGFNNAIILAGGAGGGGGFSNGLFAGGGGGGGFASIYCPINLLPSRLYIQTGLKGLAGYATSSNTGVDSTGGATTYISLSPSIIPANLLLNCTGGGGGASKASGGGGGGGGIGTINNVLGISNAWPGMNGGPANYYGVPPDVNPSVSVAPLGPIYGGGGGGTSAFGYGGGTNSALSNLVIAMVNQGYAGSGAYAIPRPFTAFGGNGAYGDYGAYIINSNGGNGRMGSGGGGGGGWGGSGNSGLNSDGGNGGDGFVIIICY